MRFLFVMDGLERLDADKDTTFGFIESARARGHECLHCLIHQIDVGGGEVAATVRRIEAAAGSLVLGGAPARLAIGALDAVFIRKDPPFDQAYTYATLLLELARGQTVLVNDPRGLREANEKLYALHFARWMPRTIVTSEREAIHAFVAEVGGAAVIKPLDGAGGFSVLGLREGDSNVRGIVDVVTHEGRRLAMVQEFVTAVSAGDKRVLLLDGEPLGAILRVPQRGDMRANIHVGGEVRPAELTERERELCADMAPRLRADGLVFVGLDLIGEQLTEVNVTSPTGIRELSRHRGERVSDAVIRWVEQRAG